MVAFLTSDDYGRTLNGKTGCVRNRIVQVFKEARPKFCGPGAQPGLKLNFWVSPGHFAVNLSGGQPKMY